METVKHKGFKYKRADIPEFPYYKIVLDESIYRYQIQAVDKAGNVGYNSPQLCEIPVDITPPPSVSNVSLTTKPNGDVVLSWNPVDDPLSGVQYYKVLKTASPFVLVNLTSQTMFTDPSSELEDGKEYTYTVEAVDNAGNIQMVGNV